MSRYKPYPEYKDSGVEWIGEVPTHWEVKPFFSVTEEKKIKNTGLKETNRLSLSYGRIIQKSMELSEGLIPESYETYQIVGEGDIIFRLTDLQNDKRSLRSAICQEIGMITSAYLCVVVKRGSSQYFNHLMRSYDITKVFYGMGGGLRQSLGFDDMRRLPVIFPRKEEQSQIATFLDRETTRIDTLIEKKQRFIELLEEKRQAVITHAVTKGLDPNVPMKDSGVEWIGEVPAHWEVKKLSYLCRCYDGSRVPLNALERDSRKGSVPYWGASKIIDYVDESLFDEELILLGEDGAPFFDGNKHVAFHSNGPIWPNNHVHVLKPTATSDAPFLVHVLNTTDYTFFVDGATRDKLTQSSMMQIPIQYPPDQERERIVLHVTRETTRIDTLIEKTRHSTELLKERRSALITAAVTGKIDVREEAA